MLAGSFTAVGCVDPPFGSVFPTTAVAGAAANQFLAGSAAGAYANVGPISKCAPPAAGGRPGFERCAVWYEGLSPVPCDRFYNTTAGSSLLTGSMVGLPIAPQPGWGGGPNVPAGPPATTTVWGVHTTPATGSSVPAPSATATAVMVSWQMGTYAVNVTAPTPSSLGTLVNTASPTAFVPSGMTFTHTLQASRGLAPTPSRTHAAQCASFFLA